MSLQSLWLCASVMHCSAWRWCGFCTHNMHTLLCAHQHATQHQQMPSQISQVIFKTIIHYELHCFDCTHELVCFYRNNGLIMATLGSSCPWAKRLKKNNNVTRVTDLDHQGKTGMELYVEARKSVSGVWEIPHGLSQHRRWLLSMGNDGTIESEWEMTQIHQEWRHPSPFHVKNKTCWRKREYRTDRSQP